MRRLPKTLQNELALACYAIVSHTFADFHNPANIGAAFNWSKFPEMMMHRCRSDVFLNTAIPDRHAEAARSFAADTGSKIAADLVHRMTHP